jgi:hypothetical protein
MMEAVRTSEMSVYLTRLPSGRPDDGGSAHLWNVGLFNETTNRTPWWWGQCVPLKCRFTLTRLPPGRPDNRGSAHLWNVGLLERDHHQDALIMVAVRTSEMSVYFNKTTIRTPWWWRQCVPLKCRSTWTRLPSGRPDNGGSVYLWNVGLLERDYHQDALIMGAVRTSEMSVYLNEITIRTPW